MKRVRGRWDAQVSSWEEDDVYNDDDEKQEEEEEEEEEDQAGLGSDAEGISELYEEEDLLLFLEPLESESSSLELLLMLPTDVWVFFLMQGFLHLRDLQAVMVTCKQMRDRLVRDARIWKSCFADCWQINFTWKTIVQISTEATATPPPTTPPPPALVHYLAKACDGDMELVQDLLNSFSEEPPIEEVANDAPLPFPPCGPFTLYACGHLEQRTNDTNMAWCPMCTDDDYVKVVSRRVKLENWWSDIATAFEDFPSLIRDDLECDNVKLLTLSPHAFDFLLRNRGKPCASLGIIARGMFERQKKTVEKRVLKRCRSWSEFDLLKDEIAEELDELSQSQRTFERRTNCEKMVDLSLDDVGEFSYDFHGYQLPDGYIVGVFMCFEHRKYQ